MSNLIDPDRPLLAFITKMAYSAYLNILWLICCLPIVTIGASTTALFYVTLKMAEDRDDGLTGMFFRAFRQNFLPATKLWLVLLGAGAFLAMDGYFVWHIWSQRIFWTLVAACLLVAALVHAFVLLYAFPSLSPVVDTSSGPPLPALLVGLRYLVCTLLMAGIYFLMGWVVVNLFTPAFLLGFGCCAMLCSFLLVNIIHAIGGDPDAALAAQDAESKEDGENKNASDE